MTQLHCFWLKITKQGMHSPTSVFLESSLFKALVSLKNSDFLT